MRLEHLPRLEGDAGRCDRRDSLPRHHLDRSLREGFRRVGAKVRLEHREELRAGLDKNDASVVRRHVGIVLGQLRAVELRQRAGGLDAGRPAAHDDDVQRAVLHEARVLVHGIPSLEQVIPEAQRVRQRVHRVGVLGRAFCSEEVDFRPQSEHEVVVRQRLELLELHRPLLEIDTGDVGLVDGRVVVPVDEVAQRVPDDGGLDQARGELVDERLERVVVVLVDEHDVRVGVLQLLHGADTGEAAAEDDDARSLGTSLCGVAHGAGAPSLPAGPPSCGMVSCRPSRRPLKT